MLALKLTTKNSITLFTSDGPIDIRFRTGTPERIFADLVFKLPNSVDAVRSDAAVKKVGQKHE